MSLRIFGLIVLLAAFWGPSFMFIKVAVAEIPPLTMVVGRVGLAAILLYSVLRVRGVALPKFGPIWRHFALIALVHNAIPFTLFNWGEQYIDSASAAILNGTTPLFTIILAHFFVADDRLTTDKALGILIGFGGLALLIGPALLTGFEVTTLGLLAVALAAVCYGIAIVYSRLHLRGLPPLVAPTAQLTLATVYLLPLSLIIERPLSLPMPSLAAIGSLVMLAVVGTALAFILYYYLIERTSATNLSMVTYLIPVFGIITGIVVLGEQPGWNAYAGCLLILAGVMIVNGFLKSTGRRLIRAAARP